MQKQREIIKSGEKVQKKLIFSDFVIPFLAFIIFIVLTIFVYIPMITETVELNDDTKNVISKQEQMKTLQVKIDELDGTQLYEDYQIIDQVIPTRLEVADFVYFVDELAKDKGLKLNEIRASNSDITSEDSSLDMSTVSGPLSYEGNYTDVLSFLEDLQKSSPYIVSVNSIDLSNISGKRWSFDITINGYYLSESVSNVDPYQTFVPYTNFNNLVEMLRNRSKLLD
ncbi:MAG TPA: type 4a pilus biogenesis protein PilO [Candidatus Dojkabacteria bacterium]|nr:type 4a pilus biogenesis protein PilO [Candidatus Dojkabacteria bacterium]